MTDRVVPDRLNLLSTLFAALVTGTYLVLKEFVDLEAYSVGHTQVMRVCFFITFLVALRSLWCLGRNKNNYVWRRVHRLLS